LIRSTLIYPVTECNMRKFLRSTTRNKHLLVTVEKTASWELNESKYRCLWRC